MKKYFVYIMQCVDNSYFIGMTTDLETEFLFHQNGYDPNAYTFNKRPVEIVFYTEFDDEPSANAFKKQIKGWNRKKKEAIINDEWETLPNLSKRKFPNR